MPEQPPEYVVDDARPQRQDYASFETKPAAWTGTRWDTGAGYERWRSWEYRPETPRRGKEDVYVSVHRLAAVAWLLPRHVPLSALAGVDVHHNAPEVDGDRGVPWDNREDAIELLGHGRHSEITQAELRAYGEDARRAVEDEPATDDDRCAECGAVADTLATSDDWDGSACLDCALELSDGAAIEV